MERQVRQLRLRLVGTRVFRGIPRHLRRLRRGGRRTAAGVDPRGRQLRRGVHRRRERGDVHRRATAGIDVRPRVRRGRLDFGRGAPLRWLGQFVSRDVRVRRLRCHRERRSRTDVLVDARDWIVVCSDVRRGVRVVGVEIVPSCVRAGVGVLGRRGVRVRPVRRVRRSHQRRRGQLHELTRERVDVSADV